MELFSVLPASEHHCVCCHLPVEMLPDGLTVAAVGIVETAISESAVFTGFAVPVVFANV